MLAVVRHSHPPHLPSHKEISRTRNLITSQERALESLRDHIALLQAQEVNLLRTIQNCRSFIAPVRRLPFDILGIIFEHLSKLHGADPETLLVVNRVWREAALSHPRVWRTLILDDLSRSKEEYLARLKRFTRRSHPLPLDITIRCTDILQVVHAPGGFSVCDNGVHCPGDMQTCKDMRRIVKSIRSWLRTLTAGTNLERWRSFTLDSVALADWAQARGGVTWDANMWEAYRSLNAPTPRLEYLSLSGISYDGAIFPATPRLKVLYLSGVSLPNLRLPTLPKLVIDSNILGIDAWIRLPLCDYVGLKTLELHMPAGIPGYTATFLHCQLPNVHTLIIDQAINPQIIALNLPSFENLVLKTKWTLHIAIAQFSAANLAILLPSNTLAANSNSMQRTKREMHVLLDQIVRVLRMCPHVRQLSVSPNICAGVKASLEKDATVLPFLEELRICEDEDDYGQVIEFQRDVNSPTIRPKLILPFV